MQNCNLQFYINPVMLFPSSRLMISPMRLAGHNQPWPMADAWAKHSYNIYIITYANELQF